MEIYTHGMWLTHPGREEEFLAEWETLARTTMQDVEGAGPVWMLQDRDQKNRFFSFGAFASLEAVAAFRGSSQFATSFEKMRPLLENVDVFTGELRIHLRPEG